MQWEGMACLWEGREGGRPGPAPHANGLPRDDACAMRTRTRPFCICLHGGCRPLYVFVRLHIANHSLKALWPMDVTRIASQKRAMCQTSANVMTAMAVSLYGI